MFKILLLMAMMLAFPAFAADVSQPVDDYEVVMNVMKPAVVGIPTSNTERSFNVTGETTQYTRTQLSNAYHLPFEVAWRNS